MLARESSLFKPSKKKQLLQYVVGGEQQKAFQLMQQDPELLCQKGEVTDPSGREFKNISAVQYAAWAMDMHMLRALTCNLSQAQNQQVYDDLLSLKKNGTSHGACYDVVPLVTAFYDLGKLIYRNNHEGTERNKGVEIAMCKRIHVLQHGLPAHAVAEFCDFKRAFLGHTNFSLEGKDVSLLRTLTPPQNAFLHSDYGAGMSWYQLAGTTECAENVIHRDNSTMYYGFNACNVYYCDNAAGLKKLMETRSNELQAFTARLAACCAAGANQYKATQSHDSHVPPQSP